MPKRKKIVASDEEEEEEAIETGTESEEEKPLKSKPKPKTAKTVKKPVIHYDSAEEEPPTKKKKPEATASKRRGSSVEAGGVLTDTSGDKYVDLGKRKRATVRVFKGAALLDIREFYDAGGEEKPGKKGISLSPEQWNSLKTNMDAIDTLLAKVQKK